MIRARFTLFALVAACGGAHETAVVPVPVATTPDAGGHLDDPDLNHTYKRLLSIDWSAVPLSNPAEIAELWQRIAPTGDDWSLKLDEVPDGPITNALATELLLEGNLTCWAPAASCASTMPDLPPLEPTATLKDPCLRRQLALWSLQQLGQVGPDQLAAIAPALRQSAAMPAPESELVVAALLAVARNPGLEAELLELAWKAGQHSIVNGMIGGLEMPQLIDLATRLHVDGALDGLTAKTNRDVFMKAIGDEHLQPQTREQALTELGADDDKLAPDLLAAIVGLTKSPNCDMAAFAARLLEKHGDPAYLPKRPRSTKPDAIMRGLCVLAAYERDAPAHEASLLPGYLPKKGLELFRIDYDALSDTDPDGDGDVHTSRTTELIDRTSASLPEAAEFAQALQHCTKTTCTTDDLEFKLTIKAGLLARVEIIVRPPCQKP
ncbi:hypothetical protein BH11MYX1_BH11MYX1_38630 [soil metagenome]